eukprot:1677538-Pleurochrysis_carterae.AAC.1
MTYAALPNLRCAVATKLGPRRHVRGFRRDILCGSSTTPRELRSWPRSWSEKQNNGERSHRVVSASSCPKHATSSLGQPTRVLGYQL